MFRAIPCSSSGGQIVFLQHLVSSLSHSAHRLRADSVRSQPVHWMAAYGEWRYEML